MSSDLQPIQQNPFTGAMNPSRGLSVVRRFTKEGQDPFWSTTYELRNSDLEFPRNWSEETTELFSKKIFCTVGVPLKNPDGSPQMHVDGLPVLGAETSVKQVIHRIAGYWRLLAEQRKVFASQRDAIAFYDELVFMMLHQMVSPSISTWIQCGRSWAYGIKDVAGATNAPLQSEIYIDDPAIEAVLSDKNSSHTVRLSHVFMDSIVEDREWHLRNAADGSIAKTVHATDLWNLIADRAASGAPLSIHFDTTQSGWNTCLKSGRLPEIADESRATLNLGAFFDPKIMVFDVDSFKHAARLWAIALDLAVFGEQNQEFRSIGLGITNAGSGMLMAAGIPYDSKEARAILAAVTSILTGEAYAASAELAKYVGTFQKFDLNRSDMLRVVRNHRRATYNAPSEEYEKISIKPSGLDSTACPVYLLRAARGAWDRALELGEIYGYRNAEVTDIASDSNIDVILNSGASGIDPALSLLCVKKNSDGLGETLVNESAVAALKALRYSADKIDEIVQYVCGTRTLVGAPYINHEFLLSRGYTALELNEVEKKLGLAEKISDVIKTDIFGFSSEQLAEVEKWVCGSQTIDGAPHVKKEHYPVFDCACVGTKKGSRFIHYAGQIRMVAAVQPFLSGTITNTIYMSQDVTKESVGEAFGESWKLGLKSVAARVQKETSVNVMPEVVTQPVVEIPVQKTNIVFEEPVVVREPEPVQQFIAPAQTPEPVRVPLFNPEVEPASNMAEKIAATSIDTDPHAKLYSAPISPTAGMQFGTKRALPAKRSGITVEAMVGNQQVYLRTGEYPNGDLGEIFIDMYREGAAFRSVLNCFAISISMGLQHGVPLEKFVEKFTFTRFEPSGFTSHPNVKMCTSIVDYIFRVLAVEYLGRMDLAQVPPEGIEKKRADKLQEIAQAALQVGEQTALLSNTTQGMHMGTPPCDTCGHSTVQNGDCFRCMNCGSSMGCN